MYVIERDIKVIESKLYINGMKFVFQYVGILCNF